MSNFKMTGSSAAKEYMKLMDIIEQDQMTSENSMSLSITECFSDIHPLVFFWQFKKIFF